MRGGKELPSSSALDSPSVLSRLATPPPVIHSDMSQVIDDTTSAMNDTYDDASTMLDNVVPLGEFLTEQIAKAKEIEETVVDEDCNETVVTRTVEVADPNAYSMYSVVFCAYVLATE